MTKLNSNSLLTQLAAILSAKDCAPKTKLAYLDWTRRFIVFVGPRPIVSLSSEDVTHFLNHLEQSNLSLKSRAAARSALLFFFKHVLCQDIAKDVVVSRYQRLRKVPQYLSDREVQTVIAELKMPYSLIAQLMVHTGIRLTECLRIRLSDVKFHDKKVKIEVFNSRGHFDRVISVPSSLFYIMRQQYDEANQQEARTGFLFPAVFLTKASNHLHPSSFQRAVQQACRDCGIKANAQIFRHTFALNAMRENSPHEVKELLGIKTLGAMSDYRSVVQ